MSIARNDLADLALQQMDCLYRFAHRLSGESNGAEDLVQETYLRMLRSSGGFELQPFGVRPWLMRILHNVHLTRAARATRQPVAVDSDVMERLSPTVESSEPSGFEGMDERLVRALDSLCPEYREVLLLSAVEGLSYEEIARKLSIPLGTVMSRLHRVRKQLSTRLSGLAAERRMATAE